MKSRNLSYVFTALWGLGLCIGTIVRVKVGSAAGTTGFEHIALHFIAFGIFGFLLATSSSTTRARILLSLTGISIGLLTELYEHIAGGSALELVDVLNNGVSVLFGVWIQWVLRAKAMSSSERRPTI